MTPSGVRNVRLLVMSHGLSELKWREKRMVGNHFCPAAWFMICRFVTRRRRFKIMDDAHSGKVRIWSKLNQLVAVSKPFGRGMSWNMEAEDIVEEARAKTAVIRK